MRLRSEARAGDARDESIAQQLAGRIIAGGRQACRPMRLRVAPALRRRGRRRDHHRDGHAGGARLPRGGPAGAVPRPALSPPRRAPDDRGAQALDAAHRGGDPRRQGPAARRVRDPHPQARDQGSRRPPRRPPGRWSSSTAATPPSARSRARSRTSAPRSRSTRTRGACSSRPSWTACPRSSTGSPRRGSCCSSATARSCR